MNRKKDAKKRIAEVKRALMHISVNKDRAEVADHGWWSNGRERYVIELYPNKEEEQSVNL